MGQQAPIPIAPIPVAPNTGTTAPSRDIAPPPAIAPLTTQIPAGTPAPIPTTQNFKAGEPAPTKWAPFPQSAAPLAAPQPPSINAQPLTFTKQPGQAVIAQPTSLSPLPQPTNVVPPAPMMFVRTPDQDKPKKPNDAIVERDRLKETVQDKVKERDNDKDDTEKEKEKTKPYTTTASLPEKPNIFRLESDAELDARILRETKATKGDLLPTPTSPIGAGKVYQPKTVGYAPIRRNLEPNYVVHRKLFFEEANGERTGWDLGVIQPAVSTMHFFKDFLMLPHNLAAAACSNRWDTSAGKCAPNGYTPYYLYPPGFTVTGLMGMSVFYTGFAFIFP
jgi:hypothetical protein